jgi:hypothetical protein
MQRGLKKIALEFASTQQGRTTMGACGCGYTTDPEKNCNGTHHVVKAVKADLIAKLEAEGFADAAEHLKTNK